MKSTTVCVSALVWCWAASTLYAQSVVPTSMVQNGALEQLRTGYQAGRVSTRAAEKQLSIEWTAMALMNGTQDTESEWGNPAFQWATATQTFTTRGWPTACCVLDSSSIVVCGKTETGKTLIERWVLQWPEPMPAPVTHQQTGVTSVGIALPTIASRTELYKADVAGRRLVRNACGIRRSSGPTETMLLQFDDSNDIYVMHLGTLALTLLASATNPAGTLGVVPSLATREQDYVEFGDKTVGAETGYTYTFGYSNWASCMVVYDSNYQTLILLDANRDGIVEATRYYTNTQREAGGWTTATNFANYWKP